MGMDFVVMCCWNRYRGRGPINCVYVYVFNVCNGCGVLCIMKMFDMFFFVVIAKTLYLAINCESNAARKKTI